MESSTASSITETTKSQPENKKDEKINTKSPKDAASIKDIQRTPKKPNTKESCDCAKNSPITKPKRPISETNKGEVSKKPNDEKFIKHLQDEIGTLKKELAAERKKNEANTKAITAYKTHLEYYRRNECSIQ